MAQYFKIVNITKKQFIDIDELGENNKFSYIGHGLNGIVLGRLLTSGGDDWTAEFFECYGNPNLDEFFIGAWAGDKIIIAGDYDKPYINVVATITSDYDDLNLYDKVEIDPSFINVTIKVIKWLAKDEETAKMLVERAKHDKNLLKILTDIVNIEKNKKLEDIIEKIIGAEWERNSKN